MMEEIQRNICRKYQADFTEVDSNQKMGIARNVKSALKPVNGLRHIPEFGTSGWYIWAGEELKTEPDFFLPVHIYHVAEWNKDIEKYLALPPGWRFLIDGDYEDVWFDESLLDMEKLNE